MDLHTGQAMPDADTYPLYHRNDIGPLHSLIGASRFAVLCGGFDLRLMLPVATAALLDDPAITVVQLVPPDGDGDRFHCDLDLAYTAVLADHGQNAVALRRDYTVCGVARDEPEPLAALVASLRK